MLLLSIAAYADCTMPDSFKARLHDKPDAKIYADLGSWFAGRKDFACAADAFASASRLQPASASLAYMWGLSLFSSSRPTEALAPLHRAEQLDPADIRSHQALGAVLDQLQRIPEAEGEWRTALSLDAHSATALDNLSSDLITEKDYKTVIALLGDPSRSATRSARQNLNLGIALAGMSRFEDAISVLREGLHTTPDSLPIADELAVVLMLLNRNNEAYAVFEQALQQHPEDRATQLLYLRTLVSSHSNKAQELAGKLLAAYPNDWEVLYLNGLLKWRESDFQQARTLLERSVALHPGYAKAHVALGNTFAGLKDLHGAKEQFEKAIALGDNQPDVRYFLARVLYALGENAAANETLRIYRQMKDAESNKGLAAGKAEGGDRAMAAGNAGLAASLYQEALDNDPDEALLYYKLSRAMDKLNDISGEKTALQRAIELNPELSEAQNQMGYLGVRDNNPALAETSFRAAIHASPTYVVAWINLAAVLASEAKWDDARQALDRALEIDPANDEARRLGQAIAAARSSP